MADIEFEKDLSVAETGIEGLKVVDLAVHGDSRGWFKENWQRAKMTALGIPDLKVVQNNISYNDKKGVIVIDNEEGELDEDTVMMDALEAGAADFEADGPALEITCDPDAFNDVVEALEGKGYAFASAEIEMVPQNYVTMSSEEDVNSMEKLLDMLDDNDDVQNVWHNWQQD